MKKMLFKALYPLEYPLVIIAHIIYGAWAVGLLAFFGVIPNEKPSYFFGIPIVVLLLAVFFRNPNKRKPKAAPNPVLRQSPAVPPVNNPTLPKFPPAWKKGGQEA